VVTADDGEEGLRVYKKHQPSIALLLTDVMMPNMNGMDLADRDLQLDSHLPVLFMSGDAPRGRAFVLGASRSLSATLIWSAWWPRCCMLQTGNRKRRGCHDRFHRNFPQPKNQSL
jgi:CheY-like chemotaxis protein